jgi:hypothetical protein
MRRSSRDCPRQTFTRRILPKAARTDELIWITAGSPCAYPTVHMHPNKHRSVWLWFLVCDWLMIGWSVLVLDGFTAAQMVNKLSRFANRSITHCLACERPPSPPPAFLLRRCWPLLLRRCCPGRAVEVGGRICKEHRWRSSVRLQMVSIWCPCWTSPSPMRAPHSPAFFRESPPSTTASAPLPWPKSISVHGRASACTPIECEADRYVPPLDAVLPQVLARRPSRRLGKGGEHRRQGPPPRRWRKTLIFYFLFRVFSINLPTSCNFFLGWSL